MADFDKIRDETLLFFLDHLMDKGQPRTLHDLSCQFGAKGFTKEMRQIAGGSQSGLKKFLAQFPSLFSIEGDNVFITPLTSSKNGLSARDYTKETVEFFSDKLVTYGNAEVPLKSLFGHRSQASSEIRHVSGQNVKEFKDFLCAHADTFIVRDDYVVLKCVLDKLEKDGQNESLKRMPEEITFDPYLMQQLVTELEETLFSLTDHYTNKISIDFIFTTVKSKEKLPPLWNNFVKLPSDLTTFLHMNSRVFLVQGNMVSLTVDREQALREKKGDIKRITNTKTSSIDESQDNSTKISESIQRPSVDIKTSDENHNESSQMPLLKSPSINSNSSSNATSSKMPSFNQRIRSQIIKIVSDNLQFDSRNANTNYINESNDSLQNQPSDSFYDSIDLQLIKPRIVVTNKECEEVISDVFKNCSEVALDLEGINLGTSGEVTLIQIAFIHSKEFSRYSESNRNIIPKVYLFDVLLNSNLLDSGLRKLLESEQIVKIAHDVRNNSVSLHKNFNITLNNVFDTQVAHLILQQQSTGKPAYKPTKYISLYTLCSLYGGPNLNPKTKDKLHKIYRKDFKYWQKRPLNEEMLQFAMTDVYALLPSVYRTMRDQIRPEYEPLFKQLTHESIFTYINTDEIKQIKRQRKFELELTDLKMKLFNNDKKKIVLSNREIRLLRYIDLTDEIRNKIEGPQNVAKKLKRFDSKKANGIESTGDQSAVNEDESKEKKLNSNQNDGKLSSKLLTCDMSDDEVDELDSEDDDEALYEEETENESINSSLKSHEYAVEFVSNSTDESLMVVGKPNPPCCCNCHQNGVNSKTTKQNGEANDVSAKRRNPEKSCDMSTQTLSTGDIVITKIFFQNTEENS